MFVTAGRATSHQWSPGTYHAAVRAPRGCVLWQIPPRGRSFSKCWHGQADMWVLLYIILAVYWCCCPDCCSVVVTIGAATLKAEVFCVFTHQPTFTSLWSSSWSVSYHLNSSHPNVFCLHSILEGVRRVWQLCRVAGPHQCCDRPALLHRRHSTVYSVSRQDGDVLGHHDRHQGQKTQRFLSLISLSVGIALYFSVV